MSKDKVDLTHLSAFSANVNFGKFYLISKLITKENEMISLINTLYRTLLKEGCGLITCDMEVFIRRVFGHFSFLTSGEASNEIFDFVQMEDSSFLKHVPMRWLPVLPAMEKMLNVDLK